MPLTVTGCAVPGLAVVPFPSCPSRFSPQHRIVAFERSAQVCPYPAARPTAPVRPFTATGVSAKVSEAAVAPLPGLAQSPALRRAVRQQRARELVAGDDPRRRGDAADRDEHRGISPGAIAELSELVPSRALRRPVGKAHARVFAAG